MGAAGARVSRHTARTGPSSLGTRMRAGDLPVTRTDSRGWAFTIDSPPARHTPNAHDTPATRPRRRTADSAPAGQRN